MESDQLIFYSTSQGNIKVEVIFLGDFHKRNVCLPTARSLLSIGVPGKLFLYRKPVPRETPLRHQFVDELQNLYFKVMNKELDIIVPAFNFQIMAKHNK